MKKYTMLLALLFFSSVVIFAEGTDELKSALNKKDTAKVQLLLESASNEDANKYEAEILDKAKKAVSNDDLDYASTLSEIVLLYDFDNSEAQKLFNSIEKAKKAKAETEARKKAEEKKKQEEEQRRKEFEEQQRQLEEFKQQKKQEEQKKNEYIESVSTISFKNFPMSYSLNLPLEISKSSFADEFNKTSNVYTRFGFGLNANVGFNHPYVNVNMHLTYNFLPIQANEAGTKSDFRSRFTVGLPSFSKWFKLSLGINTYSIFNDNNAVLYNTLTSPTIGIGIENLTFNNNFSFSFFTDMNFITFDENSEINYAWDMEAILRYTLPVTIFKNGKLYLENTTSYTSLIVSKQSEWFLDTQFSFGVSLNE